MKKSTTENEKKMDKTFDKKELKKEGKKSKNQHSSEANNQKIIADLKIKLKEAEDKLLRELAENENLRKRHEKESQENLKYAIRNFSTEFFTSLAISLLVVIKIDWANSSCSACDKRSRATWSGLAVSSHTIKTSEGPAIESIPTFPKTCLLASAT